MNAVVYPNLLLEGKVYANPYIQDFILSLEENNITVLNKPSKNPLLSLFDKENIFADIYFFHWLENVPMYKYGNIQTLLAILLVLFQKARRRKIIWFLHNKKPHDEKVGIQSKFLMNFLLRFSDLIVTHASDGIGYINNKYPAAIKKVKYLDHPTKDRTSFFQKKENPFFDLLIWGGISKYKGILEFLQYVFLQNIDCRIRIVGKCDSEEYFCKLEKYKNEGILIENRSLTFRELSDAIANSKYVLVPYNPESVLSSGILMDSLSLGARVIGPNVGSFKDYSMNSDVNVYVFDNYSDIFKVLFSEQKSVDIQLYKKYLNENSWDNFVKKLCQYICNVI